MLSWFQNFLKISRCDLKRECEQVIWGFEHMDHPSCGPPSFQTPRFNLPGIGGPDTH